MREREIAGRGRKGGREKRFDGPRGNCPLGCQIAFQNYKADPQISKFSV